MVDNFQDIENLAVSLPITSADREIASSFSARQTTKQKAEQVLYNTLAVLAVKSYLEMLGISTDLAKSDSWNPVMRTCDNVADLNISDLGRLECRPLKSSDASCHIPMEVWDFRLGYVAVRIHDSLKKAALLGFVREVTTEEVAITSLKPIEALIDRLHDLKASTANSLVDLKQWFDNIFSAGWLTVDNLLDREQLTPLWGFRNIELTTKSSEPKATNSIQRAKLIDLGIQFSDRQVVLLVEITSEVNDTVAVVLQVHPSQDIYLPETLTLKVIESSGEIFMQARARSKDNFIQLQFSGRSRERFTVQIVLLDAKLTEHFQL